MLHYAELNGSVMGLPYTVLAQMLEPYDNEHPSASQIAGGMFRRCVLERLLPYYANPSILIAMLRGTLMHKGLLEVVVPSNLSVMRERRLTVHLPNYPKVILSGQIDAYYGHSKRLEDYKTCTKIPLYIKEDHVYQLAFYCWFLRWSEYEVDSAAINYIAWDSIRQVTNAMMPDGHIDWVMKHPHLYDQEVFEDDAYCSWLILNDGYMNGVVPSKTHCQSQWCNWCPVKWACDIIPSQGLTIDPQDYDQRKV